MLVQHLLENAAVRWPSKVALISGDLRITYGELETAANRLAHLLSDMGVSRGDRVAILLDNSIETAVCVFGALKAGAIFMVLHPSIKRDRLETVLADAEPSVLITDRIRLREAAPLVEGLPSLHCLLWDDSRGVVNHAPTDAPSAYQSVSWDDLQRYPGEQPTCASIDVDLATLIYTSGSTGQPKGVMCSHRSMVAVTNSINAYLKNTYDDIILNVLPLAFGYGLYQLFLAAQVGATVILDKGFAFPAKTVSLLEQEHVTALPGVPMLYALLLKYPDLLKRDLSHLRYMTNAAAAIPTAHLQQIRAALPHVQFFSMYGQTECARTCYLPPEDADSNPSSVGIAIPNTEVYIINEDGERLPPGEVGELVVRGSNVMQGYWRAPELTAQRFRPGPIPGEMVLHSGDLFKMDGEGYLYFVSRKDDIIKSRGEKVSPREVENVVCHLEGVAEAVVVGVPDPMLGQAIRLVVVPHANAELTERDIRSYCARHLEDFMLPKYIEVVSELPRNDNGKVDKKQLATL